MVTPGCGAETEAAADPARYAAFLRAAFRSGLDGRDALGSLGFRCAYDGGTP